MSLNNAFAMNGVLMGIVTNNDDPEKIGRIKVKIPRIDANAETDWVRVMTFMAGKDRGGIFIPEVQDEVLIAFENGDINMPIVIGALFNGKDTPPAHNKDKKNNIRMIKSRSGHVITFDDTDGEEKIEIIDKSEKNKIVIDSKENKITIESEKDIDIKCPKGTLTIEAESIDIKATKEFKLEAKPITIESKGTMDLKSKDGLTAKGKPVKLESGSTADIKASGAITIKGAKIDLN